MPKSQKDLEHWNMMLDSLAEQYPDVADTVDDLQSQLADQTQSEPTGEEEEPVMPGDENPAEDMDMGSEPSEEEHNPFPKY